MNSLNQWHAAKVAEENAMTTQTRAPGKYYASGTEVRWEANDHSECRLIADTDTSRLNNVVDRTPADEANAERIAKALNSKAALLAERDAMKEALGLIEEWLAVKPEPTEAESTALRWTRLALRIGGGE